MFKAILRTASLIISVVGAGLGIVSGVIDDKRNELIIEEKVDNKFNERFGKEEDEETKNEEEEES